MGYSKAVIINPPNPAGYVSNKDSMGGFGQLYPKGAPPFPPLDLAYLAAVLEHDGQACSVIEAGALDLSTEEVRSQLGADRELASTLVLVRTSLPTIDADLDFCRELRGAGAIGAIALFGPPVLPCCVGSSRKSRSTSRSSPRPTVPLRS